MTNNTSVPLNSQEEKLLAALIYGTSFFTTFIGPLVIWLLKKNTSSFIDYHGREYFNFLLSYFVYSLIAGVLTIVLIGIALLAVLGIAFFLLTILGGVKALLGEEYRLPFIFRVL
ncbi:DUF4870 domain-containing protein [Alkalicoccus daliensis]|uniref:DUF4870 domain-containing protein n=1 Tax=Alkalicoccus daliensis TaxID=745820 RepID=A0A1G9ZIG4_9BACI|nr:DUF4870 domain-containing protein [Alkalicoccus daliensis]SDN20821.1 hypothetical protein SAMN04488053_101108 [Alkalicoccus daliensis]